MRFYQSDGYGGFGGGTSELLLEWTQQHGCGINDAANPNKLNCDVVIQFLCDDRLRDGVSTDTPQFTKARTGLDDSFWVMD